MHACLLYTGGCNYTRIPFDCHFLHVKYVCVRPDYAYGGLQVQMLFTPRVRN